MKYLNKSIYAFALVGMMGLWSCSQEDVLQGGDVTAKGHQVPVTLTVNRSDAQTRTILSENTATGGLNSDWRTTDKLHVMVKGQGIVGTLDFVEFPDESQKGTAVFAGNLTLEDGVQKALVYYCDDAVAEVNASKQNVRVSLKNQKFHSVEELSAMDLLYEHIDLNVNGNVANVTQDEYMKAHLAMAHFSLDLPDGTEGTLYVSDCGVNSPIYHTALINTYDYAVNMGFEKDGSGNVTELAAEVKADHQVYMALPAQYSGGKFQDVTLSFRFVASNGDEYTYAFENPTPIEAGKYYNSFMKNEGEENGTMSGVIIPLEKVGGEEPDLSNNPLYKWTETNLERVSDDEYWKGKFADSYTDNGHYYQFGRNVGFEDYTEASACAFVYSSEVEVSAGLGDGTKYIYNSGYYTASNLKDGERTMGFMIPCEGNTADWWPSSENRSDNWNARATASGYTPSDLYEIDGVKYKLPSVADFKEILPSSDITTAFTSETDVKTINNQFVAFRWKKVKENDAYYLQIKAKVVASKTESVDWDSTSDELIVTRYFKAAGIIFPYHFAEGVWSKLIQYTGDVDYHWASEYTESTFRRNGYTYNGLMHAALAIPYSNPSYEMTTVSASVHDGMTDDEIDVKLTVKPENNFNKYRGSYWTSDGSRTIMDFIFDEDSKIGTNRLLMTSSKAAAYSIRLIKAE